MIKKITQTIIVSIASLILALPLFIEAQAELGEKTIFNVEPSFDYHQRSEITATLVDFSSTAYWYVDTSWWESLTASEQKETSDSLAFLAGEFEATIYPKLTRAFGSEYSPGIDKDTRITILIHEMQKGSGGYNNTADGYSKIQFPKSNEREMFYLNAQYINTTYAKSFLAHELMHLITFNQKTRQYGTTEEVWLNEARAEYAPTFLGYDDIYEGSNLQKRVEDFLEKPSDSLTEWRETSADYGVVNLFAQYLVDHYGVQALTDSLKRKEVGVASINAVLKERGFTDDLQQIFTNWAIAVFINDCQVSEKYCYYNSNLGDFRIIPLINYLPFVGESTLSVTNTTKDWSGNWHKFIGGKGLLVVNFNGNNDAVFKFPYVVHNQGGITVEYLILDSRKDGEIVLPDFGSENVALTIIPITFNKFFGFGTLEPSWSFSWTASTQGEKEENIPSLSPQTKPLSQMSRGEILNRIAEIQALVNQLLSMLSNLGVETSCEAITQNLYFGMKDNYQVRCLQEFLKSRGSEIYPEGITNGNFYTLTEKAVIRFQEKYASEVLTPYGLTAGTGFVGPSTRAKINQILGQQ